MSHMQLGSITPKNSKMMIVMEAIIKNSKFYKTKQTVLLFLIVIDESNI